MLIIKKIAKYMPENLPVGTNQPKCILLKCSFLPGAAVDETLFQSPRSNILPRAHIPSLVKSSLLPPKVSPVSDLGSNLGSPFNYSPLNRKAGILELNSPWHGSVQSPHIMRRGPKLWTIHSGKINCPHPFLAWPCVCLLAT